MAAFIDSNVLAACVLLGFFVYDYIFAPNKFWLYFLTAGILLAYEPLAVTWRGQTFGHWYKGIKVVRADTGQRVDLLRAVFRYTVKYLLWPLSLSWMVFSHWHHSIQDLVSGTRVVPAGVTQTDNSISEISAWTGIWQVTVTLVWLFTLLWLFNTVLDWQFPQCNRRIVYGYCKVVSWIDDLGDIMIWILVFWYGTAGRLPGARTSMPIE